MLFRHFTHIIPITIPPWDLISSRKIIDTGNITIMMNSKKIGNVFAYLFFKN